jgi:tetratricopeptide (TPR) repeat protein
MQANLESAQRKILAFASDPNRCVLAIRMRPEAAEVALRMVAGMDQRGALGGPCVTGPAEAEDGETLFGTVHAGIQRHFASLQKRPRDALFAPRCSELAMPRVASNTPSEAVSLVEQAAERLAYVASRLIVVATVDDTTPEPVRLALHAFACLLRHPRTRLLILDGTTSGLLSAETSSLARTAIVEVNPAAGDPRQRLQAALDVERLTLVLARGGSEDTARFVEQASRCTVLPLAVPYTRAQEFETALLDQAISFAKAHGVDCTPTPDAQDLERAFELLGRTQQAIDPTRPLAIVLDPRPLQQPQKLAAVLAKIERLPLRPMVKLVLLDREGTIAGAFEPAPVPCSSMELALGAERAAGAARERLASGAGSNEERFTLHLSLSGEASARGEATEAIAQAREARALATTAEQIAGACLFEGQAAYRAGQLEHAARVLGEAIDLDQPQPISTPMLGALCLALAAVELERQDYPTALELYAAAEQLYGKSGLVLHAVTALAWRGEAERRAGDRDGADRTWAKGLERLASVSEHLEDTARPLRAQLFERRARLLRDLGDSARAEEMHRHACKHDPEPFVPAKP